MKSVVRAEELDGGAITDENLMNMGQSCLLSGWLTRAKICH